MDPMWKDHGGESYQDLSDRVYGALKTLLDETKAMDIVLVCHKYVIKVLLAKAIGLEPTVAKLAMIDIPPGSISRIDYVLGYAVVKFVGENPKKLVTTYPREVIPQKETTSPDEETA